MAELPFSDIGLQWFEDVVGRITAWFTRELTAGYEALTTSLFETPLPAGEGTARVFGKPAESDALWRGIYEATVAGEMLVFGLVILFVSVQTRHFLRVCNVGSAYGRRRARRSAWTGAVAIVAWYWIAVVTLSVVDALTIALLPDVGHVASMLLSILPTAVNTPIITLAMAAIGAISMLLLRALFFIREVLLFVFLYGMPVGLGVAFGHIPVVSQIARRLCAQFIPLAVLPLPAALLFRGYAFLFTGDVRFPVAEAFFQYLVVVSLPVVALYVTWRTFRYASPRAASALGTAGRGTVLAGTIAGAAAIGGPKAAAVASRYGPTAAASTTMANRYTNRSRMTGSAPEAGASGQTPNADRAGGGVPAYRRTENDPAYY